MEEQQDMTKRGKWTSASNAEADSLCPGRHLAQQGLPDVKTDDAEFGNAIHNALFKQDPAGLTTEQEDIYQSCVDIEKQVHDVFYRNSVGEQQPPMRERRLWIKWPDGLYHSGQIDVGYLVGVRALIIDYKTLPGQQAASPKNMQLRDQACLVNMTIPGLKEVGVCVIQPLVTRTPEITIYQASDLGLAVDQLYFRVKASNTPNAPRKAGDVQCKFCLAKSTCREFAAFSSALVTVNQSPAVVSLASLPVTQWTPAMRATFLDHMPSAEQWLAGCKSEIKRLMEADPESVPGYKLRPGNNMPTLTNPPAIFETFSKTGGTLDQFMKCVEVSKTALKEAVKETTKLKGKKLDEAVESVIGPNITYRQNSPSIVKKT